MPSGRSCWQWCCWYSTGEILAELDDVDIPARIVIALASAWITDSGSSNVYRIGPVSRSQ